jgi:glycosyltransferase involved in cell wall biosynthesis
VGQNLFLVSSHHRQAGEQDVRRAFPNEEFRTITAEEFASDVRLYIRRFKQYQRVVFYTYDFDLSRTVLWHGIVWWLGRNGTLLDGTGRKRRASFLSWLFLDVPQVAAELLLTPVIFSKVMSQLARVEQRTKPAIPELLSIVYLRTDHWFGIKSGGSVTHIAGVANAFRNMGIPLFFISSDQLELIDQTRTPVIRIKPTKYVKNTPDLPQIAYNLQLVRRAHAVFRLKRPTLIYQRYSQYNYSGAYLATTWRLPLVLEYNGSEVWIARHWGSPLRYQRWAEEIEQANLKAADAIVVVSKPMKQELTFRGIEERKILVNPNGVDTQRFDPRAVREQSNRIREELGLSYKIVVGFIGTFGRWHGADILAEAVRAVVERNTQVHFLFIGDGVTMPDVRNIVKASSASQAVTFTGMIPQQDGPFYLGACDILVSPHVPNADGTRFFGSPTKLFEYMAMSKAIIASRLEQIGEILDSNTAVLVRPGSVEQLSDAIVRLAGDPNERRRLGDNARAKVISEYTWDRHAARILEHVQARMQDTELACRV